MIYTWYIYNRLGIYTLQISYSSFLHLNSCVLRVLVRVLRFFFCVFVANVFVVVTLFGVLQASKEAENLVIQKMRCQDYVILCVEDTTDWKHATTRNVVTQVRTALSLPWSRLLLMLVLLLLNISFFWVAALILPPTIGGPGPRLMCSHRLCV